MEQKRLLTHFSQLAREQENEFQVALTLVQLSSANLALGLHEEGTQRRKKHWGFSNGLVTQLVGPRVGTHLLGYCIRRDNSTPRKKPRYIYDRPPPRERPRTHRLSISSKPRRNAPVQARAIHHFGEALGIASTFGWHYELSCIHYSPMALFVLSLSHDSPSISLS